MTKHKNSRQLPVIPAGIRTHDNSMTSAFRRCPLLYYYTHILGKTSKAHASALNYGGLMHVGLKIWYEDRDLEKACQAMLSVEWEDPIDDFRTRDRCVRKLVDYTEYYGEEENWIDRILLNETPFEISASDGFRYGGKMDLLVLWHGKPWVMDHKTTARYGSDYFDQFVNSSQMAGYVWAATQLHGEQVAGVIINCIVTHKVPKPIEQQVHRQAIMYSPEKIEEWKRSQIYDYHQIHQAIEANYFPPRWDNCINKFGKCAAFEVCKVPQKNRGDMLDETFIDQEWNWMDS